MSILKLNLAQRRLDRLGISHAHRTLAVLAELASTKHAGDRPAGWVEMSIATLMDRTGRGQDTITKHVAQLVEAGEVIVWETHNRRTARPRQYLLVYWATDAGHRRALARQQRRESAQITKPLPRETQYPDRYPESSRGTGPLFALPDELGEHPKSDETHSAHGPVPRVPVLVTSPEDGTTLRAAGVSSTGDLKVTRQQQAVAYRTRIALNALDGLTGLDDAARWTIGGLFAIAWLTGREDQRANNSVRALVGVRTTNDRAFTDVLAEVFDVHLDHFGWEQRLELIDLANCIDCWTEEVLRCAR